MWAGLLYVDKIVGTVNGILILLCFLLTGGIICALMSVRRMTDALSSAGQKLTSDQEKEYIRIDAALQEWLCLKRHCEPGMTRAQTASELSTTPKTLHHYFLDRKGVDFNTWRTMERVEEAKVRLLEDVDMPLHIVGEACGFSDRSNFHRQFVRFTGCSPKQWRDSGGRPEAR